MASAKGCLRAVGLGCLGLIALGAVLTAIAVLGARSRFGERHPVERQLRPPVGEPMAGDLARSDSAAIAAVPDTAALPPEGARRARAGRLVLDVKQGGFTVEPGLAGEGVRVDAKYDSTAYELVEDLAETDSTWVYTLRMRRIETGLVAALRQMMGGGDQSEVRISVPPDMPVALEVDVSQGGFEAELGGLWITAVDVDYGMGGVVLGFDEPLREPMDHLRVEGSMGGFEGLRVGNASPRRVDVEVSMGGAELDLRGAWRQDSDLRLEASMGGMEVDLPDDVRVEGLAEADTSGGLRHEAEVALPVLRFAHTSSMGEIEIVR